MLRKPLWARRLWLDGRLFLCNRIIAFIPIHLIRLGYYRIVMKARIGTGSNIFMGASIDSPGGLTIGTNTVINQDCRLDTRGGLSIGNNVSISAQVCILTASHDIQSEDCAGFVKGVAVDDYVFIGTRALILPGVSIGRGAVVGAGSVVTKNVQAYSIVAGSPSKIIGYRNQNLNYSASYPRLFH